ncbi:MAG: hypothetical protein Q9169_005854 [Polycauliona sp. 2 TL-2023]
MNKPQAKRTKAKTSKANSFKANTESDYVYLVRYTLNGETPNLIDASFRKINQAFAYTALKLGLSVHPNTLLNERRRDVGTWGFKSAAGNAVVAIQEVLLDKDGATDRLGGPVESRTQDQVHVFCEVETVINITDKGVFVGTGCTFRKVCEIYERAVEIMNIYGQENREDLLSHGSHLMVTQSEIV